MSFPTLWYIPRKSLVSGTLPSVEGPLLDLAPCSCSKAIVMTEGVHIEAEAVVDEVVEAEVCEISRVKVTHIKSMRNHVLK
jgi:hypothetical protein